MRKNMGTVDRVLRALVAVVIVGLYLAGTISGGTVVVLGIIAVMLALTSTLGSCPAYKPFGISTCKKS